MPAPLPLSLTTPLLGLCPPCCLFCRQPFSVQGVYVSLPLLSFSTAPQANEALRSEIERLRGEPRPLVAARAAREETLADKEKFLKLLDNLQVCWWGGDARSCRGRRGGEGETGGG